MLKRLNVKCTGRVFLIALAVLFVCGSVSGKPEKKLTVMVYLCGSNLESVNGSATADLYEILHAGVNREEVNIVIAAGGSKEWKNRFSPMETAIYELKDGPFWEQKKLLYADEEKGIPANMGEMSTLRDFLAYARENDPASQYALILWDHGGGPLSGVCYDMLWAGNNLTMEELCTALSESPFSKEKLSWIGFDACLMASLETAHLMAPYADYMIASEETEPAYGWNYSFLRNIEQDADGAATGKRIVDAYFEPVGDVNASLTLSCVDLSRIADLEEKLGGFFGRIAGMLNKQTYSEISRMRHSTREFGRAEDDAQQLDLVDLGDLILNYARFAPEEAKALLASLDQAIQYSRSSLPDCIGLSIYHPYYNKLYYEKLWQQEYNSLSISEPYRNYVEEFAGIWLDASLGKWENLSGVRSAGETGISQTFTFRLTDDQMQHFSSASLLILNEVSSAEDSTEPGYSQLYVSGSAFPDENGVLELPYSYQALYVTDDNGQIIDGPVNYFVSQDGHILIQANYGDDERKTGQNVIHTVFECETADTGTDLPILAQYVYDEKIGIFTNRIQIQPQDYTDVYFLHDYRKPTYNGENCLTAFQEWETSDWAGGYHEELPLDFHFRFYDSLLIDSELYACFQITDTQSVTRCTELIPLGNAAEHSFGLTDNTYEDADISFHVDGRIVNAGLSKQLELTVQIRNLSDHKQIIRIINGDVVVNGSRSLRVKNRWPELLYMDPSESRTWELQFDGTSLSGLNEISEIVLPILCEEQPDHTRNETESDVKPPEKKVLVLHPVGLDVSAIAEQINIPENAAAQEDSGTSFSLISCGEDYSGSLSGILYCRNDSDELYDENYNALIVNDVMIELKDVDRVYLPAHTDAYLCFKGENRQVYDGYFNRKNGLDHLVEDDWLSTGGIQEITSLTFTNAKRSFIVSEKDFPDPAPRKLTFTLPEPLVYEKRVNSPSHPRLLLFSIGETNVYGERILLADRTVILSLILENTGPQDEELIFDQWKFNDTVKQYGFLDRAWIPAGTLRRVYIDETIMDDLPDQDLHSLSVRCRPADSDDLSGQPVSISLDQPYAIETDEGRESYFRDLDIDVVNTTE